MTAKPLLYLSLLSCLLLFAFQLMPQKLILDVHSLTSRTGDVAAVYLSESNIIDDASPSKTFPYRQDVTYQFSVRIPTEFQVKLVRFDPVWAEGTILLKRISLSRFGTVNLPLDEVTLMHGDVRLEKDGESLRIVSTGSDPFVSITRDLSAVSPDSKSGLAMLFTVCAALALVLYPIAKKLMQMFCSLRNQSSAVDNILRYWDRIQIGMAGYWRRPVTVNYCIVLMTTALVAIGSVRQLTQIGGTFTALDYLSAISFVTRMLAFCVVMMLACEVCRPLRHVSQYLAAISLSAIAIYFYLNALLLTLNGMSLVHGAGMLLNGGIANLRRNLGFAGFSDRLIELYLVGAAAALVLCVLLIRVSVFLAARYPLKLSAHRCGAILLACMIAVTVEQAISSLFKPPRLLSAEQQTMPGYLPLLPAANWLLKYRIKQIDIERKDKMAAAVEPSQGAKSAPIFLFILESMREDFVTDELTPALAAFRRDARVYQRSIASGNASHYAWFAIVNSRYPLFWESLIGNGDIEGSPALAVLQRNGYKVDVFSSKDLSYLGGLSYMAGSRGERFDNLLPRPELSVPALDEYFIDRLGEHISRLSPTHSSMNLIWLDAMHFPYYWSDSVVGMEKDFVGDPIQGVRIDEARSLMMTDREKVIKRYRNSVRFTDSTFGRFVGELKSRGIYEDSIIVVVSDHGQQFMEHGLLFHGATLYPEDVYVPLYIKLPHEAGSARKGVISQLDIMPTILDYLRLYNGNAHLFDGNSVLNDEKQYALTAVAGLQNTPFRFALETVDYKLDFELESSDPHRSESLFINGIRNRDDTEFVPGKGARRDYAKFVREQFEPWLRELSFVESISME